MIRINSFKEKIFGNMATVFHRTSYSNLINDVYTEGFKPGKGAMYGKGFYSTYELNSQERSHMADTYGDIVIKFAIPIEHFFIFDYSEFTETRLFKKLKSTPDSFIQDQIDHYNLHMTSIFNPKLIDDTKYSSDIALWIYNNSNLSNRVKGIIFTGRRDGKVLVSYDTNIIIPLAYKVDGEKEFSKVERNKEFMKKVLLKKLSPHTPPVLKYPSWIKSANFYDEEIELTNNNKVIWKGGTWQDGAWIDGVWERGIWVGGVWRNGTWIDGTWGSGTWEDGTWKDGLWLDGTWKDGIWESGIWDEGLIYDSNKQGNFDPSWKWRGDYVRSPISPKEYWS